MNSRNRSLSDAKMIQNDQKHTKLIEESENIQKAHSLQERARNGGHWQKPKC